MISLTPTCVCNDGYSMQAGNCIFNCQNIEGAKTNATNDACVCENNDYYIDEIQNKCLLKQGCHLDEVNCRSNGQCKEDLEHDWTCECNEGYYFDGSTCIKENPCENDGFPCGDNCCTALQICLNNNTCDDLPASNCQNDNECSEDYFCDPIANKCIKMDDDNGCIFKPVYTEEMHPLLAWQWPGEQNIEAPDYKYVMMAPMVANITDDNNDGVVDLKDTPDVIFSTFKGSRYNYEGVIRVIDGKTGTELATTNGLTPVVAGWELAVGDIDNDGQNEIVGFKWDTRELVAFRYNLITKKMEEVWKGPSSGGAKAAAIADVDHDGKPEVISQNYILNGEDGTLQCAFPTPANTFPIVEDTNDDGIMDVISGQYIFSGDDCRILPNLGTSTLTVFLAMADLNLDGNPEIVVINSGQIFIFDTSLNQLITPFSIGDSGGAPPTIANFDEDDALEIAVAGKDYYTVLDVNLDATPPEKKIDFLWKEDTEDRSSRMTGSSLFDFEGDGIAEVLYADQCYFRVYNGVDGSERFKTINSNGTLNEYPIVADVDNDGKSEIIVGSNNYGSHSECPWWGTGEGQNTVGTNGIRMYESPDNSWVRTRRIWNQHTYHVTNVNEDRSIPINEEHNWLNYNNYRLNVQGKGVFNSPNFVIDRVDIEREDCPKLKFKLKIKFSNQGSLTVNANIPISIYKNTADSKELIDTIYTDEILLPGYTTTLEYDYIPENPDSFYSLSVVADDKGNGTGEYNECNEVNNTKIINFKGSYTAFCKAGIGECMRFAPYACNENNEIGCTATPGEPVEEICGDGFDNNCDGSIDEDCGCGGKPKQECYHASSDLISENSECKKGKMFCVGGESWGECSGDILPVVELCNGKDDDCDGEIDEDFTELGSECEMGLGICKQSGHYVCDLTGNMICDAIPLDPQIEICNDTLDNNCNGLTDEKPCQQQ